MAEESRWKPPPDEEEEEEEIDETVSGYFAFQDFVASSNLGIDCKF